MAVAPTLPAADQELAPVGVVLKQGINVTELPEAEDIGGVWFRLNEKGEIGDTYGVPLAAIIDQADKRKLPLYAVRDGEVYLSRFDSGRNSLTLLQRIVPDAMFEFSMRLPESFAHAAIHELAELTPEHRAPAGPTPEAKKQNPLRGALYNAPAQRSAVGSQLPAPGLTEPTPGASAAPTPTTSPTPTAIGAMPGGMLGGPAQPTVPVAESGSAAQPTPAQEFPWITEPINQPQVAGKIISQRETFQTRRDELEDQVAKLEATSQASEVQANQFIERLNALESARQQLKESEINQAFHIFDLHGLNEAIAGKRVETEEAERIVLEQHRYLDGFRAQLAEEEDVERLRTNLAKFYGNNNPAWSRYVADRTSHTVAQQLAASGSLIVSGLAGQNNQNPYVPPMTLEQRLQVMAATTPTMNASVIQLGGDVPAPAGFVLRDGNIRDGGWPGNLVVENPKPAGLYVSQLILTASTAGTEQAEAIRQLQAAGYDPEQLNRVIRQTAALDMPLIAIQNGQPHAASLNAQGQPVVGEPVPLNDLLQSETYNLQPRRGQYAQNIFADSPYNVAAAELDLVDSRNAGRAAYIEFQGLSGALSPTGETVVDNRGQALQVVERLPTLHDNRTYAISSAGEFMRRVEPKPADLKFGALGERWDNASSMQGNLNHGYVPISPSNQIKLSQPVKKIDDYVNGIAQTVATLQAQQQAAAAAGQANQAEANRRQLENLTFNLYGFGEQAGSVGDTATRDRAMAIAEPVRQWSEMRDLVKRRTGNQGELKLSTADIPKPYAAPQPTVAARPETARAQARPTAAAPTLSAGRQAPSVPAVPVIPTPAIPKTPIMPAATAPPARPAAPTPAIPRARPATVPSTPIVGAIPTPPPPTAPAGEAATPTAQPIAPGQAQPTPLTTQSLGTRPVTTVPPTSVPPAAESATPAPTPAERPVTARPIFPAAIPEVPRARIAPAEPAGVASPLKPMREQSPFSAREPIRLGAPLQPRAGQFSPAMPMMTGGGAGVAALEMSGAFAPAYEEPETLAPSEQAGAQARLEAGSMGVKQRKQQAPPKQPVKAATPAALAEAAAADAAAEAQKIAYKKGWQYLEEGAQDFALSFVDFMLISGLVSIGIYGLRLFGGNGFKWSWVPGYSMTEWSYRTIKIVLIIAFSGFLYSIILVSAYVASHPKEVLTLALSNGLTFIKYLVSVFNPIPAKTP